MDDPTVFLEANGRLWELGNVKFARISMLRINVDPSGNEGNKSRKNIPDI